MERFGQIAPSRMASRNLKVLTHSEPLSRLIWAMMALCRVRPTEGGMRTTRRSSWPLVPMVIESESHRGANTPNQE